MILNMHGICFGEYDDEDDDHDDDDDDDEDGRNPKQPPGFYKNPVNHGISTTNLNWFSHRISNEPSTLPELVQELLPGVATPKVILAEEATKYDGQSYKRKREEACHFLAFHLWGRWIPIVFHIVEDRLINLI